MYSDGLRAGRPGFDSLRDKVFFSIPQRPDWLRGPPSLLLQWLPRTTSQGVKRAGRDADHSPQRSAEVKNAETTPPLAHPFSWDGP
jgi:hypothetical protein